jgi:hypothetical protein
MTSLTDTGEFRKTPDPFNPSRREFDPVAQRLPTRDLRALIELWGWDAIEFASDRRPGGNRAYAEIQLESLVTELERRKRLWERSAGDPLRPHWPARDADLTARVQAVKVFWPIDRFCTDLLAIRLQRSGRDRWKATCPLPGHDDRSPSFVVYEQSDSAWCFGCNRGGDIIALTGYVFCYERFYDRLEHLERVAGIGRRGGA